MVAILWLCAVAVGMVVVFGLLLWGVSKAWSGEPEPPKRKRGRPRKVQP